MGKKNMRFLICLSTFLFLAACSSSLDDSREEMEDAKSGSPMMETERSVENFSNDFAASDMDEQSVENKTESSDEEAFEHAATERMIIHQARLQINVKDIDKAQANIEAKVNKYEGYMVESNVHRDSENNMNAYILVRIPEKKFQPFLTDAEETAAEVVERNVTGQDVTEQFIDLESRLKSKRAVEERLLEFMKDAKKTEDLLKISSDLATTQEEIEVIVGQMNYLENQTSFSTIEISMNENSVKIPDLDNKDLNTWEKTQKQLAISTNFLLAAGSAIIVFIIGNLPVFVMLAIVGLAIYIYVKRMIRKNRKK